jgi:filamentous hemagglutinin family protein
MTSVRRRRVGPSRLLLLLLFTALCVPQVRAASLPTGGSVAAGTASIGTASNKSLTVTQTSSSAVINWQSFSVGSGYTVNFVQPSSTSAILNRVTGSTPSTIAGSITANGQVYLINPNGIAITSTGTVNTGAFVASTLGISDADFMAGKRVFSGSGASAAVSNAGIITIGRGGYAALLGGSVDNAGTITVPLGKVGLGSGEQATLDLSGDGFLQVAIPTAASGSGALVANSGTISADGGLIQLSAAAAKDLARQAINMSGTIEAKSVGGTSGNIVLAGSDGAVEVSGTLDASSSDTTGGTITITGRDISLSGANLDASGATGGGTIRVGGDRQGSGTLQHADTLTVDAATTIKADAISTGNGGDVVLWSDELTTFAGTISAKGGALSGDGGQAEVSGKALLDYTGFTDLSAAHGAFGTLLLDPYNVTISSSGTSGFTATSGDSVISAATLLTALGGANVTVSTGSGGSQAGNITVAAPLSWSSGTTLTLSAAGSIAVNADITIAGSGGLALVYATNLTFADGASATYTNADGTAATSSQGGTLTINGTSYTLLYSMAAIDAIDTTGLAGRYALATSLDATGTTYRNALVGNLSNRFTGTFEGLGHTITGLTINSDGNEIGLFGVVGPGGIVRDIGLIGGSVKGYIRVGDLVGYNLGGTIINSYATGAVSGSDYSSDSVGGLVGSSESTDSASSDFGIAKIINSYATGTVTGHSVVGGLVGESGLVSTDTNATSYDFESFITNCYATGTVTANSSSGGHAGGLVGSNASTITNSYATGAVSGAADVGGLVGTAMVGAYVSGSNGTDMGYPSVATYSSVIINSYATGAVTGSYRVGGLVGGTTANFTGTRGVLPVATTITASYATGAVTGTTSVGGLVGYLTTGSITRSVWDIQTTGQSSSIGEQGYSVTQSSIYGLTTAQLQDGSSAGNLGGAFTLTSGLYPYLTSFFPNGVQAVSGIAYKADGTTVLKSSSSGAGVVYVRLGDGSVITTTTGANGYYYAFAASGSIDTTSGSSVLAYTVANSSTGATDAATYTTKATGSLTGVDVYGSTLTETADSSVTALSALDAAYATATLGTAAASSFTNRTITALGSGFTIDAAASVSGTLVVSVPGNLTIAAAGSVSAADVSLQATGAFINQSGSDAVTITSSSGRWLIYSADSDGDTFDGLDSGNTAIWSTAAGATVSDSGNRYVFKVLPTVTITTTDASKTYGDLADVAANYTVTGAVNGVAGAYLGATATGILSGALSSTGAAASADAGSYGYTLGTLSVASGYLISLVNTGTLTVNKATLLVTAADASMTYGDAVPTLSYGVSGWKNSQGDSLLTSVSVTTDASSTANAGGSYTTTASGGTLSGAASGNYTLTYAAGSMTISARPITVTANAASSIYGDTPNLTYVVGGSGLVNGDTLSGSLASGTRTSNVGVYDITQGTLTASSNYSITSYTSNTLTISARPITVTANALSSYQGFAVPALTYTVGGSGLVNGDSLSGGLATVATSSSAAGRYAITQGNLAASANYALSFVPGLLTVSTAVPSDTSTLAPAVTRSWAVNNDWALPAAPTSPLELTFGGQGTLIFSSPDFDGLKRTPGTQL